MKKSNYRKSLEELLDHYPELDGYDDDTLKNKSWDLYQLSGMLENGKVTGSYFREISKRIISQ